MLGRRLICLRLGDLLSRTRHVSKSCIRDVCLEVVSWPAEEDFLFCGGFFGWHFLFEEGWGGGEEGEEGDRRRGGRERTRESAKYEQFGMRIDRDQKFSALKSKSRNGTHRHEKSEIFKVCIKFGRFE